VLAAVVVVFIAAEMSSNCSVHCLLEQRSECKNCIVVEPVVTCVGSNCVLLNRRRLSPYSLL